MLIVSDLADSRKAVLVEFPYLSGRKFDEYYLEQIILTDNTCV